ncbi:MAG: hypothetical protein ACKVI4_16310 [Actinomycetales bacterium]
MMYRIPYTTGDVLSHFHEDGSGKYRLVVVGNGPLSEGDHAAINRSKNVVRFNDVNYWRRGEPTALRVARYPSARAPPKGMSAPIWGLSTTPRYLPPEGELAVLTWIYEPLLTHPHRYGLRNFFSYTEQVLEPWEASVEIFEGCAACFDNLHCNANQTSSGASTGAVALSELHAFGEVASIDVYGMNWGGGMEHVDFVYPDTVSSCCTKCTIHATPSSSYGDTKHHLTGAEVTLRTHVAEVVGGGVVSIGAIGAIGVAALFVARRLRGSRSKTERVEGEPTQHAPLLPLAVSS